MTTYARLNAAGIVECLVELTAPEYAAFQANGKALWLRRWSVDPQPTVTASQLILDGEIIITATDARQSWIVRDKTPAELAIEENEVERTRLRTVIANLAASVQSPDVVGTAGERIGKLEARTLRLERIALWLLRRFT